MNIEEIKRELQKAGIAFLENEPLKNHTSFKIGGAARLFAIPSCVSEIVVLKRLAEKHSTPLVVLGHGTNVLAPDEGLSGITLYLGESFSKIELLENEITAQSGALLSSLCLMARDKGLTGLEFAYGIPASVGGAVLMNAGAYGGEICSVIKSVTALTAENEIKTFKKEDCGFDYRKSIFDGGYIILSAVFSLSLGEREKIAQKMEEILSTRKAKQPLNFPSAGSTFRRPQDNFAAALIDKCGLKGFSVGGAEVSPLHAGFVINKGNATAKDVTTLCEIIKNKVFSETGVHLELEIKIL